MIVTVKYFASLREQTGKAAEQLELDEGVTVRQVWERSAAAASGSESLLCAVNMEYADWEDRVGDGDEVAFFPRVTGGQAGSGERDDQDR